MKSKFMMKEKLMVLKISNQMLKELKNNSSKSGWDNLSYKLLLRRLKQEVEELEDRIEGYFLIGSKTTNGDLIEETKSECADVANFCAFIYYKLCQEGR